jgi:hypothetical protein
MKTPREILLAHHRAAGPKLDAIRQSTVAAVHDRHTDTTQTTTTLFQTLWRELILPSRRIWSGVATAWLLIIVVNVSQRDHSPVGKTTSATVMMSLDEQQRLMNKYIADRSLPADADRPRTFSPKPRTEKIQAVTL